MTEDVTDDPAAESDDPAATATPQGDGLDTSVPTASPEPRSPGPAAEPPHDDAERLAAEPVTTCLNCGARLPGRFCPDCGQKDQPIRQPAHVFIAESVSEYFGLDGRLWRSLGALLVRPGHLTRAYLDGRRTHYLRPLRLYLTASLSFFFALSLLDTSFGAPRRETLAPLAPDSLVTAETLADRLADARAEVDDQRAALDLDTTAALGRLLTSADVGTALAVLSDSLAAAREPIAGFDDDSLVAVASVPEPARSVLTDSLVVTRGGDFQVIGGDGLEKIPNALKGRLAERLEAAESDRERALVQSQITAAFISQIPTALFIVLPFFAVLLKVFYATGAGRRPRLRARPSAPGSTAPWWRRLVHGLSVGRWAVRRQRNRWRHWRRRRKARLTQKRTVRGAPRRLRQWVAAHPRLRWWRLRRLGALRHALHRDATVYYSEHLVFALHVHAFTFLAFLPLLLFSQLEGEPGTFRSTLDTVILIAIPVSFLVAQRRVYRQTWWQTIWKACCIGVVYSIVIGLGAVVAAGLALRLG